MLIVEDDDWGSDTVARWLRSRGNVVAEAPDAEHALEEAPRFLPDVVLLDHRLGDGRDGIACLASLRGLPLARQPAVALITGDWTVTDRTAELKALDATLVFKPCDLDDFDDLVTRLAPEAVRSDHGPDLT